ncbi:MAG: glycosyltransferase family 4 protein [Clostridium sp.]|nr:glycosyltransferase family 4 protein [Clostridium sp.]
MKIGFDAKRAAQNRTGLGNYSRFVINGLTRYAPDNAYVLYVPDPRKTALLEELDDKSLPRVFPSGVWWRQFRSLWRVAGVSSRMAADGLSIYHGLSNELPLTIRRAMGVKSVVTVHDLIFLRYPAYYKPIDRWIYNYKFRRACRLADRVIAVSECTKRDIVDYYHVSPDKIDVVYQGCACEFYQHLSGEHLSDVRQRYALPQRYILYVGSIEERKNLKLVVEAMHRMTDEVTLVAVGKRTPYLDEVMAYAREHGLEHRIRLHHKVPFTDLPAFYQMATVFVYPSRFEGFGIPILEALVSRVPVIAATGSCLEEAGGPGSLYVHPDDSTRLAVCLTEVLSSPDLRLQMVEKGLQYASRFEAGKLTADLLDVYRKLR